MKHSEKDVRLAIGYMSSIVNKGGVNDDNIDLPKLIENIVYDMLLYRFYAYYSSPDEYAAHNIIYSYVSELRSKGFVTFNEE